MCSPTVPAQNREDGPNPWDSPEYHRPVCLSNALEGFFLLVRLDASKPVPLPWVHLPRYPGPLIDSLLLSLYPLNFSSSPLEFIQRNVLAH